MSFSKGILRSFCVFFQYLQRRGHHHQLPLGPQGGLGKVLARFRRDWRKDCW